MTGTRKRNQKKESLRRSLQTLAKGIKKRAIKVTVRETNHNKIPEAVEKTAGAELRENIIAETTDAMLDALNDKISKHDLTFEEALHALHILHLSIVAKYIDFRIDMKFEDLLTKFEDVKDRRVGVA